MRVVVELLLYESGEMGAQNACVVCGVLWSVIAHFGVFSQRNTNTRDLGEDMSALLGAAFSDGVQGGADLLRQ